MNTMRQMPCKGYEMCGAHVAVTHKTGLCPCCTRVFTMSVTARANRVSRVTVDQMATHRPMSRAAVFA